MEIVTRSDAVRQGLKTYFTGKECVNKHVSHRYTQSGTCAQCINPAIGAPRDESGLDEVALTTLVEMRLRAYLSDLMMLRETALELCKARFPKLTARDVAVSAGGTHAAGGTAMYRVKVPQQDIEVMQGVANALLNAHKVDISWTQQQALKATLEEAEEGTAPPEWSERP